jgi:hypothetical protein
MYLDRDSKNTRQMRSHERRHPRPAQLRGGHVGDPDARHARRDGSSTERAQEVDTGRLDQAELDGRINGRDVDAA